MASFYNDTREWYSKQSYLELLNYEGGTLIDGWRDDL